MALEDEILQSEILDIIELMQASGLIYNIDYIISIFVDDIVMTLLFRF